VAKKNGYKYSYPDILNKYYALGIPSYLGKSAHPLFLAILHKGNQLQWLTTFAITNEELIHLSALTLASIKRARKTLLRFRINDKPLVEITEGGFNQIPVYTIHYDLINGGSEVQTEVKMHLAEVQTAAKMSHERGSNCAQNKSKTAKRGSNCAQNEPLPNVVNECNKEKEGKKSLPASHNPQSHILENGMTWGELLAIGNTIMIGAFDQLSFGNNADWMRYIETQPKENILKVADMEYVKSAKIRYVIERMYEELKKLEREAEQKPKRIPAPLLTTEQLLEAGHPADYYTREDAGRSTPVDNIV